MIGWFLAIAVVMVLVALGVAWQQRQNAIQWRQLADEAELAMHHAQDALESSRMAAALGDALVDVAPLLKRIDSAAPSGDERIAGARAELERHAALVREYDDAVRYCLQPVELMPSADEADLERLLKFVSAARRRLFAARAALIDEESLNRLPELAGSAAPAVADAADPLADALARIAQAVRDGGAETGRVLRDVVTIADARHGAQLESFERVLGDLPAQLAPAWLGTILLALLDLTAEMAGAGGELSVQATPREDHGIDIEVHGRTAQSERLDAYVEYQDALEDQRQRLDERRVALEPVSRDPRSRGFILHLPLGMPARA